MLYVLCVFLKKKYSDNQHVDVSSVSKSTSTKDLMIECDTPRRGFNNKTDCSTKKMFKPANKESSKGNLSNVYLLFLFIFIMFCQI